MQKLCYLNFIILLALFLLPEFAFSIYQRNNIDGAYIAIRYQPTISHFKNFHIKETNFDTEDPIGFSKFAEDVSATNLNNILNFSALEQSESYKSYDNDLLGLSLSIGLLVKNLRVEFEGSYKSFDTKRLVHYRSNEGHKYFAIPRKSPLGVFPSPIVNPIIPYTIAKNNGIAIISNIINLCNETKYKNFKPYICLGVGVDFIEVFDVMRIKFACQGKTGVSYPINPKLAFSASIQYHKVAGNQFKFLPVTQANRRMPPQQPNIQDLTALLTLDLEYFSSEIGLNYYF